MRSTVAVDTSRLEEWEHEPDSAADAWTARTLNDALADLGPVQPFGRVVEESWSRAALPDDRSGWADLEKTHGAMGGAFGMAAEAPFIPPPPRPTVLRHVLPFEFVEEPRPPVIGDLSDTTFADFDAAGVELVWALAETDSRQMRGVSGPLTMAGAVEDVDDMLGPSPMIIERARAEKELGVLPALPAVPRANPLHGLAIGFSLSLVAGAGLYVLLIGG